MKVEKENQFLNRSRICKVLYICMFIGQLKKSDFSMHSRMCGSNHTPRQEMRIVLIIIKGR